MEKKGFLSIFSKKKPVIGMLHLKGQTRDEIFDRFRKELDIYIRCGVDGVIAETYYGTYSSLEKALQYMDINTLPIPYGVNCLNVDAMGFYLAEKYHAAFLQIDSVVGHVKPRDEETLQAFFDVMRPRYDGYVLGGVRFKYQPVMSVKTLAEDLATARQRCDGVCVTQERTGQETSVEKIEEFRRDLGDFPLIVAAGTTARNIAEDFRYADAAIVGSYFKDTYQDTGDVSADHVTEFMAAVEKIREGAETC